METIQVETGKPYPIYLGRNFYIEKLCELVAEHPADQVVILTDEQVSAEYLRPIQKALTALNKRLLPIIIPAGEVSKTRATKEAIEDQMLAAKCMRDTLLIALGGGVVTDIAGFVAATYCRGIDCIYVPTSLLAMVDASVGGKTAVNTQFGKNTIGAFYQPIAVLMDVSVLSTLSYEDRVQGFSEMLKAGIIRDSSYYELLRASHDDVLSCANLEHTIQLIKKAVIIKRDIVVQDETEQNLRAILNFGHTVAHAIERVSAYQVPHGIAVLLGMYVELKLLGLDVDAFKHLLDSLDIDWARHLKYCDDEAALIEAMRFDKKNIRQDINFIALKKIGATEKHLFVNYNLSELAESLQIVKHTSFVAL